MNTFAQWAEVMIQALSRMLLHSVWQGALLALVAGIVIMATKRTSAAVRYNLMLALFGLFILTTAGTFVNILDKGLPSAANAGDTSYYSVTSVRASSSLSAADPSLIGRLKTAADAVSSYFNRHYVLIVSLWFVLFVLKSLYMAGNIVYMQRVRRYNVFTPSAQWQAKLTSLCDKLKITKAVLLLESGYLKAPVLIGYFKPVILIPVGMLAGIPAEQIEAVLLHELAHIKRRDYLVNFIQRLAEAVFFFNPGLLWISHLLREERENCCDDIAIAQTNSKEDFVKALISFKEHAVNYPAVALAFSGRKSSLLNRIMRIVYQENKTFSIKESSFFLIAVAVVSLMAFTFYPAKHDNVRQHVSASKTTSNVIKLPLAISTVHTSSIIQQPTKAIETKMQVITSQSIDPAPSEANSTGVTANPTENIQDLIARAGLTNDKFYQRVKLGNGDDIMQVYFTSGSKMMATLPHNAKVAFIVDGVLHDEAELYTFDGAADSYSGKRNGISGSKYTAEKLFPDLDLSNYDAYIALGIKPLLGTESP